MLPDQAIKEYQSIYKQLYGKPISVEKATKSANQLINLVCLIEGNGNGDDHEKLYAHSQ